MNSQYRQAAFDGAVAALRKCLDLHRSDILALFYDETTEELAKLINSAATELELITLNRLIPVQAQQRFGCSENDLCFEDQNAFTEASGILTCLCDYVNCSQFRKALIDFGTATDKRLAHMPGATLDIFAQAVDIDYGYVCRRCDDLAVAMTLGTNAALQSYVFAENGEPAEAYDLQLELGGLKRRPITSTGIIDRGTWGNIPGAETFIAPIEGSASGTFVLNGSFTDNVFYEQEYVLLTFTDGRLVRVSGKDSQVARFHRLQELVRASAPINHDWLAELGVGVNPSICELTGKSLIDEKCFGTAHVAIGDNSRYDGTINANTHEDLVTRSPSLWVDGKAILSHGKEAFATAEWRESLVGTDPNCLPPPGARVRRTFVGAEICSHTLRVRHRIGADRLCVYTVGDAPTTTVLSAIYAQVPHLPHSIAIEELGRRTGKPFETVATGVYIMSKHGVLESKT